MGKRTAVKSKSSNFFKRPGTMVNFRDAPVFGGTGAAKDAFRKLGIQTNQEKRLARQKYRRQKLDAYLLKMGLATK